MVKESQSVAIDSKQIEEVKWGGRIATAVKKDMKSNWQMYLLALPAIIFFIIFAYLPMVGLLMAFQNFDLAKGFFSSEWVGLTHFIAFFKDMYFARMLGNTLIFSLLNIAFVFPAPIILGLMINAVTRTKYRRVILTAVYLPYFISLVVVCGLIQQLVSGNGIFGVWFANLGMIEDGRSLLGQPEFFRGIIIVSDIWQSIGFNSVIYVAALGAIDSSLYEAANMDGAGRFGKIWHVSLPSILPTIMMLLILKIGTMLSVNFEKIYLLSSTATADVAETISTYIYRVGALGGSYSYTTAIGLFNSVIGFLLLVASNWLSNRLTESSVF